MEKVKVAVIGLGRLGRFHAENLKTRVFDADLVAVSDINKKSLNTFIKKYPEVSGYLDYKEMLNSEKIDAIVIASSTNSHASTIIDCILLNKKIFCEKPLAVSLEEAKKVQEVVDVHDAFIQIGFMRRFDLNYSKAKEKIDSGDFGKPISLLAISRDPCCPPIEFAKNSGGLINDMAIHDIDLCRWLINSEVKEVFAHGGVIKFNQLGEIGDIDHANISMIFENGKMALLEVSRNSSYGYDIRTEVVCEKGAISIGKVQDESNLYKSNNSISYHTIDGFLKRFENSYLNEINYFIDCVKKNIKPSVSSIDGLKSIEIAKAINDSLLKNCVIKL